MKCDAIVDAHVHLHDCYAPARFFAAALANFASIARRQKLPAGAPAYLLMTECAGDGAFEELERQSSAQSPRLPLGEWRVSRTAEEQSIRVTGPGGELYVIAGRQVACREGLEVLLPGTRASFTDGLSIHETLALGAAAGLPRVIPWGAGKWFFARGRLLSQLVRDHRDPLLFLGDEGGRPWFWRYPAHFGEARAVGVRDLPGTDPLPFPHDVDKVGRMGSIVTIDLDPERPWQSLRSALADPATELQSFATLERTLPFVRNQAGMQLRKRRAG